MKYISVVLAALALASSARAATAAKVSDIPELKDVMGSANPPDNVVDFLKALPTDYKARPILAKESPSLQHSTAKEPRAIMENEDGTFAMTFIGNPHPEGSERVTHGYDDIEMMRYDKATGEYSMYALHLNGRGKIQLEGPNPEQCKSCHTNTSDDPKGPTPTAPLTRSDTPAWSSDELEEFVRDKCEGKGPDGKNSIGYERYSQLNCANLAAHHGPDVVPTRALDVKYAYLLKRTFVLKMTGTPFYSKTKYAVAAALANCPDMPDFFTGNQSADQKKSIEDAHATLVTYVNGFPPGITGLLTEFSAPDKAAKFLAYEKGSLASLMFVTPAAGGDLAAWGIGKYAVVRYQESNTIQWLSALSVADHDLYEIKAPYHELYPEAALEDGDFTKQDAAKVAGYCSTMLAKNREARGRK